MGWPCRFNRFVPITFRHAVSYDELSSITAEAVIGVLQECPSARFCLATGASPEGLYRKIGESGVDLSEVRITKLDEWLGLPDDHPATSESYLRRHVLDPWRVSSDRYVGFRSSTDDPDEECRRVVKETGGIDLCVLGIGANGHLGLNEPEQEIDSRTRCVALTEEMRAYPMLDGLDPKPTHGMTMGLSDIFGSRQILLLVVGESKRKALEILQRGVIGTTWPATLLRLHPNVRVIDCRARS